MTFASQPRWSSLDDARAGPELVAAAAAGLATLVGFAQSDVLVRRLVRAAPLLPGVSLRRPDIEDAGWAALIDAVTVQETRLFRHPTLLAAIEATVLPELRDTARRQGRALRLVSAGCATGEEAYTLAILGRAGGSGRERSLPLDVLGVDLSRPALAAARAAEYGMATPDPARDVPAHHRSMLEPCGPVLRPHPAVRAAVRFARANLVEPPAGLLDGADLIMCRNVLIYLEPPARAAVVAALTRALRPGGALVLGPTDSPPRGPPLRPWSDELVGVWRRVEAADGE